MNDIHEFLNKHEYTTLFAVTTKPLVCCVRYPERVDSIRRKRMVHTYELNYDHYTVKHTMCVGDNMKSALLSLPTHLMRLYVHYNFQITCNSFMKYNFYHVSFALDNQPSNYYFIYEQMAPTFPMLEDLHKEHALLELINSQLPVLPDSKELDFSGITEDYLSNMEIDYSILRCALLGAHELMEAWHQDA